MQIDKLKTFIQSSNINFLFGSGLSSPYLKTLGNVEKWLTDLNNIDNIDVSIKTIVEASIYKTYFEQVIYPNSKTINAINYNNVLENYKTFLTTWNDIVNKRANKLLCKQLNIYTTNIDTFVEKAAADTLIEFNDGFKGSINQKFNEGNFQKSFSKTSLHYQNTFELPVFNLLKMHGSINWQEKDGIIYNDVGLKQIENIQEKLQRIDDEYFVRIDEEQIDEEQIIKNFIKDAQKINSTVKFNEIYNEFLVEYRKLIIVNPTKRKFSETVMDIHFYELMRMFSNSLEKESSVLFVMGFSFADEHIREITLRAANTNPTLEIIIFSHGEQYEHKEMSLNAINSNIFIVYVDDFKKNNEKEEGVTEKIKECECFDFKTINQVFSIINKKIPAIK